MKIESLKILPLNAHEYSSADSETFLKRMEALARTKNKTCLIQFNKTEYKIADANVSYGVFNENPNWDFVPINIQRQYPYAIVPYLFSGLVGYKKQNANNAVDSEFFAIFAIVKLFAKFLEFLIPKIVEAWDQFQKWLIGTDEQENHLSDVHKEPAKQRSKQDDIKLKEPATYPRIPSDLLPKEPLNDPLEEPIKIAQCGMGVFLQLEDNTLIQVLHDDEMAEALIKGKETVGFRLPPKVKTLWVKWLTNHPGKEGGDCYGRLSFLYD